MKRELWRLIYQREDRVHLHAARIIGYAGCDPFAFYDAAKKLPNYDMGRYEQAVIDLTSWKAREASPPRYEFTAEARKAVRVLLGPTPEDPEYAAYWSREVFQPGMTEPWVPQSANEGPKPEAKPKKAKPARKRAG